MPGYDVKVNTFVSETLPAATQDGGAEIPMTRSGRYREQFVNSPIQKHQILGMEGSYFVTTNATPGSAIAYAVTAAFSDTVGAFLHLFNVAKSSAGAKRICLDYIKLIVGVVPASATAAHFAIKTDVVNRYASGATASPVPTQCHTDLLGGSQIAQVRAGALTLAAASNQSVVMARGALKNAIPVVGDEYVINFGSVDGGGSISGGQSRVPPIILGAGASMALYLWFPANATTAGQFEFEIGHWER